MLVVDLEDIPVNLRAFFEKNMELGIVTKKPEKELKDIIEKISLEELNSLIKEIFGIVEASKPIKIAGISRLDPYINDLMHLAELVRGRLGQFQQKKVEKEFKEDSSIRIGDIVKIIIDSIGEEEVYKIVEPQDADIYSNKLSSECPLGKALLGKKRGEKGSFNTPRGIDYVTVIRIARLDDVQPQEDSQLKIGTMI